MNFQTTHQTTQQREAEERKAAQEAEVELLKNCLQVLVSSSDGRQKVCDEIMRTSDRGFRYAGIDLARLVYRLMPYRTYLTTRHWKEKSREAKDRAKGACQLCNSKESLETHHRTYERRGHEEKEDLTVLCNSCHAKFHDKEPD